MKVGITTIAYNQPDALLRMAKTAVGTTTHDLEFHLFLHSKDAKTEAACHTVRSTYPTYYYPHRCNRGVARSWNDGILSMMDTGCQAMIVTNDDIWWSPGDIDKMVEATKREVWAVFCSGWHDSSDSPTQDHGMACFAITYQAVAVVGMFDENFYPAYNEDLDYAYRAENLAGLKRASLNDTMVHHIGSAAIRSNPLLRQQNYATHTRNDQYWLAKWGAEKPQAIFKNPFSNRAFTYYISPQIRHAPYPGYNRTDQEIVRI